MPISVSVQFVLTYLTRRRGIPGDAYVYGESALERAATERDQAAALVRSGIASRSVVEREEMSGVNAFVALLSWFQLQSTCVK